MKGAILKKSAVAVASALTFALLGGALAWGISVAAAETLSQGKYIFEAEKGMLDGINQYVFFNETCSGGKFLTNIGLGDSTATFTVQADEEGVYDLSVRMSYVGADLTMNTLLSVEINGEPLDLSETGVYRTNSYSYATYTEFPVGQVELNQGANYVVFTLKKDNFNFDYFALTKRAVYTGDALTVSAASAQWNGNILPSDGTISSVGSSEKIIYYIDSQNDALVSLSATLGYASNVAAETLFSLSVNGQSVKLNVNAGGSAAQTEYALASVYLRQGNNVVIFTGKDTSVVYGGLTLREKTFAYTGEAATYAMAEGALYGSCRSQVVEERSVVSYIEKKSSATVVLDSERLCACNLIVYVSYFGTREKLTDILYITVNGYLLSFDDLAVVQNGSGVYHVYTAYDLGKITLSEGRNVLTITARAGNYNLDKITLAP